jgi:hypothetical protein
VLAPPALAQPVPVRLAFARLVSRRVVAPRAPTVLAQRTPLAVRHRVRAVQQRVQPVRPR